MRGFVDVRVDFAPAAKDELDSAFEWYFSRSERAGSGFVREVERAVRLIASGPDLWPAYEADTRRYSLRKYPYSIIYRATAATLQIVAIAHHRRAPGYWRR
jgi:plasmid stabilization system protein ParE